MSQLWRILCGVIGDWLADVRYFFTVDLRHFMSRVWRALIFLPRALVDWFPMRIVGWKHAGHERRWRLARVRFRISRMRGAIKWYVSTPVRYWRRFQSARRDRAYGSTDNDAVDAPRTWSLGGWTETRPSDRLKKGAVRLRRSFRRHIRGERRHWASDFHGYWMHTGFRRYQNAYGQFPRQS